MADCCIINCKRAAKHTYTMGGEDGVKFKYCDKHNIIPKKLIACMKKGYFKSRWNMAKNES